MVIPFTFEEGQAIEVIVSDFDGTVTVPVQGADEAFIIAHAVGLAELLKQDAVPTIQAYAKARLTIEANPEAHGWEMGERIVAPALVDAFVAAQVCAQMILRELGQNVDDWGDRLNGLYQAHYLKYGTEFRPDMLDVFAVLEVLGLPVHLVTNSDSAKVQKRLEVLGDPAATIRGRVRGFAKKFVVTDEPAWLPQHTHFPSLRRKIHTRKGHYAKVLTELMDAHKAQWSTTLVIGDIAELDLAMPVEMGAWGLLIRGPNTPAYEIAWAEAHPRVQVIDNLRDVLTALGR